MPHYTLEKAKKNGTEVVFCNMANLGATSRIVLNLNYMTDLI